MERMQMPITGRFEFAEKVTPLIQRRAETLLVAVFRELLDRGRKVHVSSDGYAWSRPVRSAGALDNTDWGKLTGYVDGVQVCFDWTPAALIRQCRNSVTSAVSEEWLRYHEGELLSGALADSEEP